CCSGVLLQPALAIIGPENRTRTAHSNKSIALVGDALQFSPWPVNAGYPIGAVERAEERPGDSHCNEPSITKGNALQSLGLVARLRCPRYRIGRSQDYRLPDGYVDAVSGCHSSQSVCCGEDTRNPGLSVCRSENSRRIGDGTCCEENPSAIGDSNPHPGRL